jgi:hypothetical protein
MNSREAKSSNFTESIYGWTFLFIITSRWMLILKPQCLKVKCLSYFSMTRRFSSQFPSCLIPLFTLELFMMFIILFCSILFFNYYISNKYYHFLYFYHHHWPKILFKNLIFGILREKKFHVYYINWIYFQK